MNEELNKIAKKVLDKLPAETDVKYGFDPITIILIISVILTLIRVIQECRKNRTLIKDKRDLAGSMKRDIQDMVLKDSWFNRMKLKRILKQKLDSKQYKAHGENLLKSIMDVGVNLTEDELIVLLEAQK